MTIDSDYGIGGVGLCSSVGPALCMAARLEHGLVDALVVVVLWDRLSYNDMP